MSDTDDSTSTTADQLRAEIAQTRAELGDTVNALSDKVNVKAQAGRKVEQAKASVVHTATRIHDAAPDPVQAGLDHAGDVGSAGYHAVAPYKKPLAVAFAVAVLGIVLWRRRT